jgi:hypothetical protein
MIEPLTPLELEQELLQLVEQCIFRGRFLDHLSGLHTQEFDDVSSTDAERRGRRFGAGSPERGKLLRILREARAKEAERPIWRSSSRRDQPGSFMD